MSATYRLRPSAAGFATLRLTPLEPVSFGRVPPASQLFASPKISKQHCALSCTTDGVVTLRCAASVLDILKGPLPACALSHRVLQFIAQS